MKKILTIILMVVAFSATTQLQAQNNLIVNNSTSCAYVISVYVAPVGGCVGSYTPTNVNIPPFSSSAVFTSVPGEWVVGTGFPQHSFGVSNPIGSACNSYPPTHMFMNFCGAVTNVQYVQAATSTSPSTLDIF